MSDVAPVFCCRFSLSLNFFRQSLTNSLACGFLRNPLIIGRVIGAFQQYQASSQLEAAECAYILVVVVYLQ
jgi:hypothetical protein